MAGVRARLTDYVVAEVLNSVHDRRNHRAAVDFGDRLVGGGGFAIREATKQDYRRAIEPFERRARLAFVDASIVSMME